jgi:ribosomal protein S18 acetylase RimI-like enzyme
MRLVEFFTGVVTEAFLAEMNAGKDVDFRYDITGHHHGQDDGMVYAFNPETNGIYGQINWTSYQNETYINHIEVRPEFRRQGIARMMIEFLKKKNEEPLNWGMTTPEGTEFRKAIGDDDETR